MRTIVALSIIKKWNLYPVDVKSIILHGEIQETVYIEQPQGHVKNGLGNKVYKLNRVH